MSNLILDPDGKPYTSKGEAQQDAKALSRKIGGRHLVIPHLKGFAIIRMDDDELDQIPTSDVDELDSHTSNAEAPALDPTMMDLLSPGSSSLLTRSLDDLPGREREPELTPYIEEPIAHSKPQIMEPPPQIDEILETANSTATIEKPDTDDKLSGDLFLSPCISSFYLEIMAGIGLIALAIWVNITTDFGDETINSWMAEPGFIGDLNKTVAVIIIGLIFRFIFIYAMFSYTFENEIIKTRKGIFSRDADSINVRHVRKIGLRQNLIERILMFGDLQFFSSGSSGEDVVFQRIKNPAAIRKYIESFRED
jgi:hypothetical protein